MTEIVHKEKLQQLEQRHVQLLEGLDEFDRRLEQVLSSERNDAQYQEIGPVTKKFRNRSRIGNHGTTNQSQ